ncbi:MAG: hypothetical protein O2960_26055 [Verrucomicrobia bacterium]|nr:hypothetical protein [Verrucomicrobiota bacterium]
MKTKRYIVLISGIGDPFGACNQQEWRVLKCNNDTKAIQAAQKLYEQSGGKDNVASIGVYPIGDGLKLPFTL